MQTKSGYTKFSFLITMMLCGSSIFAQQADSVQQQQSFLSVYRYALQYDDMSTASYALANYLLLGGAEKYKDTLAVVYYRSNNMNGAYRLAKEVQATDPKNITALSLLADITGRAGDSKSSLDWYEKLTEVAPTAFNFYQLATRQFILERIGECRSSLQKVVTDSLEAKKQQVTLEIAAGNSETVPALAAAYNMLGALAYREQQLEVAKKYYEMALQAFPNFTIARQNLEGLKPKPAPAKPSGTKSKS